MKNSSSKNSRYDRNSERELFLSTLEYDAFLQRSAVCAWLRFTNAHKGQPVRERKEVHKLLD